MLPRHLNFPRLFLIATVHGRTNLSDLLSSFHHAADYALFNVLWNNNFSFQLSEQQWIALSTYPCLSVSEIMEPYSFAPQLHDGDIVLLLYVATQCNLHIVASAITTNRSVTTASATRAASGTDVITAYSAAIWKDEFIFPNSSPVGGVYAVIEGCYVAPTCSCIWFGCEIAVSATAWSRRCCAAALLTNSDPATPKPQPEDQNYSVNAATCYNAKCYDMRGKEVLRCIQLRYQLTQRCATFVVLSGSERKYVTTLEPLPG
ncbi:hypothetical protein M513_12089 [Trichuris suis]|uniref:Uncharacterized protein n=1 Tax=Trichuris suis TaxID=68888 RepID=A0A085LQ00_9BILA|nr:hypothetical protein M513_12089 [Trichuris suis]